MFKDLSMRIFLVHLAAFAASVVICATINLWLKPGTLWFPWVLLGWGAFSWASPQAGEPECRSHG